MKTLQFTSRHQRRTGEIARALNIRLAELFPGFAPLVKYLPLVTRTITHLLALHPTHVFVQCPSVILGFRRDIEEAPLATCSWQISTTKRWDPFINRS